MVKIRNLVSKTTGGRRHPFRRLRDDTRGVAAIEFAFIAPMMVGMYFGLAEIASAISMDRRISHAAHVAGDLATQAPSANETDIADILSATLRVVNRSDASTVQVRLVSLVRVNDPSANGGAGGTKVEKVGEVLLNGESSDFEKREDLEINDSVLSTTSGVVLAQIKYSYEPLKLKYFDSDITLTENFMLKPRRSASVTFGDEQSDTKKIACFSTGTYKVVCPVQASEDAD